MGAITADGTDVATFLAAGGAGKIFGRKQRSGTWRAEEYDVRFSDVLF